MGRTIPTNHEHDLLIIHPAVSFSLIAAGMAAATFAMITALCSFRRKAQRKVNRDDILQSPDVLKTKEELATEEPATSKETTAHQEPETVDKDKENEDEDGDEDIISKELPLPPGMKTSGIGAQAVNTWNASNVNTKTSQMKKSASDRRLLSSLSLKLPRSLSMAKRGSEKSKVDEANFNKRKNNSNGRKLSMSSVTSMASMTKQEESIWMKTIILGEKNRVPDEDDDAAVIFDSKGRRIPAYHPKSRQNSFIDQGALPSRIRSRQCSFINPSAIPDQRLSNAARDGDHHEISEDEQELMSLSQL